MAEALDSYDKVSHPKMQFGDWEAVSVQEAEDDSSQSGLEENNKYPRPSPDNDGRSSTIDVRKDSKTPTPASAFQPRVEDEIHNMDESECKVNISQ